jgi:hypothetical protein
MPSPCAPRRFAPASASPDRSSGFCGGVSAAAPPVSFRKKPCEAMWRMLGAAICSAMRVAAGRVRASVGATYRTCLDRAAR